MCRLSFTVWTLFNVSQYLKVLLYASKCVAIGRADIKKRPCFSFAADVLSTVFTSETIALKGCHDIESGIKPVIFGSWQLRPN